MPVSQTVLSSDLFSSLISAHFSTLGEIRMKESRQLLVAALSLATFLLSSASGPAAELKVMTSVALTSVLNELAPRYETASGNKLTLAYGVSADMKRRILENEIADVIILTPTMMEDLQKQNKIGSQGPRTLRARP
jgi:ABC-type molybdate transport system substrate-binding protein